MEEKGSEKIFEEIIVENFPNMGKEIAKSRKHRIERPRQEEPQEEHTETHTIQNFKIKDIKY